jgi:benzoyl-CoA reductase/2-hydroxyglutaryl-CoA dehydratase subunit BcrC/BadD/HgdB
MPCDSSTMNSQIIDRRLGIPSLQAEVPMRWEDRNTDKYSLVQMKRIIKFVEDNTGEKFDEKAFWTVIDRHNKEVSNEMEKWEFMKTPYSPIGSTVAYCSTRFTSPSPAAAIPPW